MSVSPGGLDHGTLGVNGVKHTPGMSGVANGAVHKAGASQEPIAIIGCGMRLPGGVHDATAMWEFLAEKREGRCRVPASRYNVEAFYGPGKPGCVESEYGHFLDDVDIADADARFWSMTPAELQDMDPQQRLALEVVYECLENSGTTDWRGKNIGSYWGSFGEDWVNMQTRETLDYGIYRVSGYSDFALANRVSYEFGFVGPSMVIRTACSSSLTGLHEACIALQEGACTSAIVGGANMILNPHMTIMMSSQSVLSPDGRCKTFDERADGYARGEGVVAIHIKKLSDAVRDGDPIRAVIRASCLNSDGHTSNMLQPNPDRHAVLFRQGHALAGIDDVSRMAVMECHGTGTAIGDPLEAAAVARVFGDKGIYLGSVKPNFGHSEGASGITSVIKMMLSLEHRQILPNRNFENPSPKIPFEEAKLSVPVELTPWPADRDERVGVNGFGIGGSNAHVLLESARCAGVPEATQQDTPVSPDTPYLLAFSANSPEALRAVVANYSAYVAQHPERLHDLSYTLARRREFLTHRAFAVVHGGSPGALSDHVTLSTRSDRDRQLVLVFTGQGAQWARMGAALLEHDDRCRRSIRALDAALRSCASPPDWSLEEELLRPPDESRLARAEFSQPCCTALQMVLVDRLQACGMQPAAVVGHSSGEIAAAYASGALSATDAIRIAYFRGTAMKARADDVTAAKGSMAAVGLGRQAVTPYLQPGVIVGCENSPSSVTLSGDEEVLEAVMEAIRTAYPDVLVRKLRVDCAYHSHHMQAVVAQYRAMLGDVVAKPPKVPFFSSVEAARLNKTTPLDASYWTRNLTSPVLFSQAVACMLGTAAYSSPVFLEIGPHAALKGPLRQILQAETSSQPLQYASAMVRNTDARECLLQAAGTLFQHGLAVDMAGLVSPGRTLVDLPLYPWQYTGAAYWSESRVSRAWRCQEHARHDILGSRVAETGDASPAWRNLLRLRDVAWIRDHRIGPDTVFPAAGYVSMAGAAAGQLAGSTTTGYTVRNVSLKHALVFRDEAVATEMLTTLRPVRLTDSLDSPAWFHFTVASLRLSDGSWIPHAVGQVRAGIDGAPVPLSEPLAEQQRPVDTAHWYDVMKRAGLDYAGRFRGLDRISAAVAGPHRAVGHVRNQIEAGESAYAQHPSTIDSVFQLLSVASFRGLARRFAGLAVPSFIGELAVRPVRRGQTICVQVDANMAVRGAFNGDAVGVAVGAANTTTPVFRLHDIQFFPMQDAAESRGPDPHAAVEMVWKPDMHLLADRSSWMQPSTDPSRERLVGHNAAVNEMALACMLQTAAQTAGVDPTEPHWLKFRAWLDRMAVAAVAGSYAPVPAARSQALAQMASDERLHLIDDAWSRLQHSEAAPIAEALHRIVHAAPDLMKGSTSPVSLLMEGDLLGHIYDLGRFTDIDPLLALVSHDKGNLRILEIGAGTGGTTQAVLSALRTSEYGERLYHSYTYTDVSAGFFVAAQDRFHDFPGLQYKVLDISQDPLTQGFSPSSFDLIVASNVLHATPRLAETLTHVRTLLAPRGHLFLQELAPAAKWINYIMGTFSGWWLGAEDGRVDEPYMYPDQWDGLLRAAGFLGVQALYEDAYINANMVTEADPAWSRDRSSAPAPPRRVTLLYGSAPEGPAAAVQTALEENGYTVDRCRFGSAEPLPEQQDIVSVLDLETPFFHDVHADDWTRFQALLAHQQEHGGGHGLLWVTGAAQVRCADPRYGLALGVMRTARTELGLDVATLEMEAGQAADSIGRHVAAVVAEFQNRRPRETEATAAEIGPDYEWAVVDGVVHVGRFHWTSVDRELDHLGAAGDSARVLDIGTQGLLRSLHWVCPDRTTEDNDDDDMVTVRVRAVGLNFRDVLVAMGLVDSQGKGLGAECAGVVETVGIAHRARLHPGDRVLVMAPGGNAFSTAMRITGACCVRLPDRLTFEDAASMAVVYGTVIEALINKAHLERGQTVLIHSACGGVGLAAIRISRMIGAEIFCTVGSEAKVDYLQKTFAIPRSHIFHSRDNSFQHDVLAATDGQGVDVVLNSLSGELLHASWACVAEFGIMLEIGKRDLIGRGALALNPFLLNRTYCGIDLSHLGNKKPESTQRLLKTLVDLYERGHAEPIHPISSFPAAQIEDAMRFMQKGTHIGKVVVTMPEDPQQLPIQLRRPAFQLSPTASYLLIGGLGGLGQAIAVWMAESGATEIVFQSPSAGSDKYNAFVQELQLLGCTAVLVPGSITTAADIQKAIQSASKPLGGVINMSMVLNDAALLKMTFDEWQATLAPKVDGTWKLHHALLDAGQRPAFFLLFSSVSGISGQWGQANYAAANTYLDAFTLYRRGQGLPSATLDVGVMADVGFVSRNPQVLRHFHAASMHVLYERDLLDAIQLTVERCRQQKDAPPPSHVNHAQLTLGVRSTRLLDAPGNRILWRKDRRMALYRNLEQDEAAASGGSGSSSSSNSQLKKFLADAALRPEVLDEASTATYFAQETAKILSIFMLRDEESLDIHKPLAALGMDSLVAIELRNWFRQNFGLDMTVIQVMECAHLADLGVKTATQLKAKYNNNVSSDEAPSSDWGRRLANVMP